MHAHVLLLVVFINKNCILATATTKQNQCMHSVNFSVSWINSTARLFVGVENLHLSLLFSAIIICVRIAICVCACVCMDSVFVYKQHSECCTIIMDMHPNVVTTRHAYVRHNSGLYNLYISRQEVKTACIIKFIEVYYHAFS